MTESTIPSPCRVCDKPVSPHCKTVECKWWVCSSCGSYGDDNRRRLVRVEMVQGKKVYAVVPYDEL